MKICETCGQTISASAPDYPATCPKCGVTYGPGGEVANHRPDSPACEKQQKMREEIAAHPALTVLKEG